MKKIKKYTPDEAFDEASRLKEKIETGEAKNYDEAEKIVDQEKEIIKESTPEKRLDNIGESVNFPIKEINFTQDGLVIKLKSVFYKGANKLDQLEPLLNLTNHEKILLDKYIQDNNLQELIPEDKDEFLKEYLTNISSDMKDRYRETDWYKKRELMLKIEPEKDVWQKVLDAETKYANGEKIKTVNKQTNQEEKNYIIKDIVQLAKERGLNLHIDKKLLNAAMNSLIGEFGLDFGTTKYNRESLKQMCLDMDLGYEINPVHLRLGYFRNLAESLLYNDPQDYMDKWRQEIGLDSINKYESYDKLKAAFYALLSTPFGGHMARRRFNVFTKLFKRDFNKDINREKLREIGNSYERMEREYPEWINLYKEALNTDFREYFQIPKELWFDENKKVSVTENGEKVQTEFHGWWNYDDAIGKFILGKDKKTNQVKLVFDSTLGEHRDIAIKYNVDVIGGGWLYIDKKAKKIIITKKSQDFGEEPRIISTIAIKNSFSDYDVILEDRDD